jgi:hypothetical protein
VAKPKRAPRARTIVRRVRLADEKLFNARMKLMDLEPGGAPERPIDVGTAALVEPKARSVPCPRCEEPFGVAAHEAHTDDRGRLREVMLKCRACGTTRSLWFRIVQPS